MLKSVVLLVGISHVTARTAYFYMRLMGPRSRTRDACRLYLLGLGGAVTVTSIGAISVGALGELHWMASVALLAIWLTALLISAYDFRLLMIPDELSLNIAACGLVYQFALDRFSVFGSLTGGLAAAAMLGIPYLVYPRLRGVEGMGLGDVKLATAIGVCVGPYGVPLVVAAGSAVTLVFAVFWQWYSRNVGSQGVRVPFAPGLLVGMLGYLMVSG